MPLEHLHMTALEMTHSKTAEEIATLVEKMLPFVPEITDFTVQHRARLIKPIVSYDHAAIALSYVPAAGDIVDPLRKPEEDEYTYHHLRRDLYNLCQSTGAKVDSRYVVPSSHLTIGRFITSRDTSKEPFEELNPVPDPEKLRLLIQKIDAINTWLREVYWGSNRYQTLANGGEWIVGEATGLDYRHGTLWYGGGSTIRLGEGFLGFDRKG
jgi:vesicle-fusing ATPase